jgi:hypothetical protein
MNYISILRATAGTLAVEVSLKIVFFFQDGSRDPLQGWDCSGEPR